MRHPSIRKGSPLPACPHLVDRPETRMRAFQYSTRCGECCTSIGPCITYVLNTAITRTTVCPPCSPGTRCGPSPARRASRCNDTGGDVESIVDERRSGRAAAPTRWTCARSPVQAPARATLHSARVLHGAVHGLCAALLCTLAPNACVCGSGQTHVQHSGSAETTHRSTSSTSLSLAAMGSSARMQMTFQSSSPSSIMAYTPARYTHTAGRLTD